MQAIQLRSFACCIIALAIAAAPGLALAATSAFYSMPTNQSAQRGTAVTVPVSISHLSDANGNMGLAGADIVLTYDQAVFTVSDTDVTQGALLTNPPPNGTWTFAPNTATPGEVDVSVSSSNLAADITSTTGGVVANIQFHVKASAPTGNSMIHIVVPPGSAPSGFNSDALPHSGPNSIAGDATGYILSSADQVDGIVDVQAATTTALSTICMTTFVSNQPFTMLATVTGSSPTGNVTFHQGTTILCGGGQTLSGGSASCTTNALAVAGTDTKDSYPLAASYSGDANNAVSVSPSMSVTVLSASDVVFRNGFEMNTSICPSM